MKKRIQLGRFKQEIGIKVGDIMTRDLVKVAPETTVKECVEKIFKFKTGSIIVSEKDKMLGIVTKRDLLSAILKSKDPGKIKVKEIMTRKVRTIRPDTDLYKALILMKKTKIKKFPVIENNKVIGFLTMKDVVKFEPQLLEQIAEAIYVREESAKLKRLDRYRKHRILHGIEPGGHIEGPCEECGNHGWLEEIEGRLICSACKDNEGH